MRPQLPSGTVTLMFTDIEGSTRLQEAFPHQMETATARHYEIAHEIVARNYGIIVKDQLEGDSVFAVFERANDATRAAVDLQLALSSEEWPDGIRIRTRAALHSGHVSIRADDYVGITVNRCARLRAIGHGEQILVSSTTYALLNGVAPDRCRFVDMGMHRLKDLQRPEHVYMLIHEELRKEFPPLNSVDLFPNNLPIQITTFIGRETELKAITNLLSGARIVTIVGPGGSGKSRLSIQVGVDVLRDYEHGAWFVELRTTTDTASVIRAFLSSLGIAEQVGLNDETALIQFLGAKEILLVLDNCEHVRDIVETIGNRILGTCPNVGILASSREPININGESIYRIPTLATPDNLDSGADDIIQFESVRLFQDRAILAKPGFEINAANAPHIARLCRVLDGIPLAIELASARVATMPIDVLASRLEERYDMPLGRDKSLFSLVDWSYQLLTESEQMLLSRASVFAGDWTLEAAESVCASLPLEQWDIVDHLASLVNKSLVIYDDSGVEPVYRMLETIRRFSMDKLRDRDKASAFAERHLSFFAEFANAQHKLLGGPGHTAAVERISKMHQNLRAALQFATTDAQRAMVGLKLAANLSKYWESRGFFSEGREHLSRLLDLVSIRNLERADGLNSFANIAWRQGMIEDAESAYRESLSIREELHDMQGIAHALNGIANVCIQRGELATAETAIQRALDINSDLGNQSARVRNLMVLGGIAERGGEWDAAGVRFDEAVAICESYKDTQGLIYALVNRAIVHIHLEVFDEANDMLRRTCLLCLDSNENVILADALRALAHVRYKLDDLETSTRLHGAASALREEVGLSLNEYDREEFAAEIADLRERLGADAFLAASNQGRSLSPGDALDFVPL